MTRYLPPPLIVLTVGALMWLLAMAGLAPTPAFSLRAPFAWLLMGTGIGIMILAAAQFTRHGTTVNPMQPERSESLVTDGIYRLTRNPMYLGDFFILLGWGLYLASFPALLASGLFVLWIDRVQIPSEESALVKRFGESYETYRRKVRRWI